MRVPLPNRFRLKYAVFFAVALFAVQQFEHTEILYSSLCALYILIFTFAFNIAGGMIYPSGNWIFFNGLLVVLVGIVYKCLLGEAGESNLEDPNGTMVVETAAMLVFGLTAALNRKLQPKRALFAEMLPGENMNKAAIGAFLLGTFLWITCYPKPGELPGTLPPALRQINHFNEMAILLATFYEVRKSGGRKSSNWVVWASGSVIFGLGLVGFGKQALLSGPFTWVIAAVVAGHNFTRRQILGIVLGAMFFQLYLVPFSQVGRNYKDENKSFLADAKTAFLFLSDLQGTREAFQEGEAQQVQGEYTSAHLYDEPQGFMDRLSMLPPDDQLISFTNQGNIEGPLPTLAAFANVIPHFIWKNKPTVRTGNSYAHEMGGLQEDDDTTGISFSPAADAYHQERWLGIFGILPLSFFGVFFLMDFLSGDVRKTPWGALYVVTVAHFAPEGGVGGSVYLGTFMTFSIATVALFSKYILPIFGGIVTNRERTRVRRTVDFQTAIRSRAQRTPTPDAPGTGTP